MLINKKQTNGCRHQILLKKSLLSKRLKILKNLFKGTKSSSGGRSFTSGNITVRHKGNGVKKLYCNLKFPFVNNFSVLISVFYFARRSAFISLCYNFINSKFFYCTNTLNTFPGSIIFSYKTFPDLRLGVTLPLKQVPVGSILHSINNVYIKSGGVFAILIQKNFKQCKVKMPSGTIKTFSLDHLCILGVVSNLNHNRVVIGKAGKSRLMGKRPKVRGVAMNPVDHPHGGQTSGGIPSVTPWGKPTKGKPTKKNKNVKI